MEVEEKQRLNCGKGMLGGAGCWGAQPAGKGDSPAGTSDRSWETTRTWESQCPQPCLSCSGRALLAQGVTVMYPNKWMKTNEAWVQGLSQTVSVLLSSVCTGLAARKWEGLE